MAELLIGTSAFIAAGWEGSFYPAGMQPRDFLTYYASRFNTVEIDSTFYRAPVRLTVQAWASKTPDGFLIAAKVPQLITHERCLVDCGKEFGEFVDRMDLLGDKLGPLLLQFPYFNRDTVSTAKEFMLRFRPFLKALPKEHKFAVEIRNKTWLTAQFVDLLREYGVALALQDQLWMPLPAQMKFDYLTADFTYVRLLGDRKGIEKQTKIWDKVIVNRSMELKSWVDVCQQTVRRGATTFVYVNNHYAGHAPATVEQFLKFWEAKKS